MSKLRKKDGVLLIGLQPVMRKVLIHAADIWEQLGQELVVTSGLEGNHSVGSMHYYGYALDLRSRYFDEDQIDQAVNALQHRLGQLYVVLKESDHIHVHFKGVLYYEDYPVVDSKEAHPSDSDSSGLGTAR